MPFGSGLTAGGSEEGNAWLWCQGFQRSAPRPRCAGEWGADTPETPAHKDPGKGDLVVGKSPRARTCCRCGEGRGVGAELW